MIAQQQYVNLTLKVLDTDDQMLQLRLYLSAFVISTLGGGTEMMDGKL